MRSFEERIAEISRRSDEIIRKRKKTRNCLMTFCALLVLCIGGWLVFLLPSTIVPVSQTTSLNNNEMCLETKGCSTTIQVSGTGVNHLLDDPQSVERILSILDPALSIPEAIYDVQPSLYGIEAPVGGYCEFAQPGQFRMLISYEDGSMAEFTLTGSVLCSEETGEKTLLTDDILSELKQLLGVASQDCD